MHTKEPFFDHDVSYKKLLLPVADDLKIPPSTDHCRPVELEIPALKGSSRRGSMEPYFPQRRYSQQSSSRSSYAKLSDVFDYNYLDLGQEVANEHAIASDSDTDYDDYVEEQTLKSRAWAESDSESDLEDYKVHLLTFKVNSTAQYTRPPTNHQSSSTDYFDFRPSCGEMAFLPTSQHPGFTTVKMPRLRSASMFEHPEIELERFLQACDYPIARRKEYGPQRQIKTAPFKKRVASDCYMSSQTRPSVSDIYEENHTHVSFI